MAIVYICLYLDPSSGCAIQRLSPLGVVSIRGTVLAASKTECLPGLAASGADRKRLAQKIDGNSRNQRHQSRVVAVLTVRLCHAVVCAAKNKHDLQAR